MCSLPPVLSIHHGEAMQWFGKVIETEGRHNGLIFDPDRSPQIYTPKKCPSATPKVQKRLVDNYRTFDIVYQVFWQ